MTPIAPDGWATLVIVLPSILALLTAALAAVLAFLARGERARTDGKIDELIDATRRAAHAEGMHAGAAAERSGQADRDAELPHRD